MDYVPSFSDFLFFLKKFRNILFLNFEGTTGVYPKFVGSRTGIGPKIIKPKPKLSLGLGGTKKKKKKKKKGSFEKFRNGN